MPEGTVAGLSPLPPCQLHGHWDGAELSSASHGTVARATLSRICVGCMNIDPMIAP